MKKTLKLLAVLSAIFFIFSRVSVAWGFQTAMVFYFAFIVSITAFVLCLVLLLIDKYL